ncbi:hypothetical protein B566_EDAN010765 [Ephemera danica]|nr:hypothetical protein B566_EDAN010765 [Ephemera danica]
MKEMVGGCCVCSDERGWAENPLVYCDGQGCTVAVHQACYGIVTVPIGPWFCRKCESQERAARVRCELCPCKDGALKRTDNSGWAHVVCALYIPEVRFGNVTTMEPIILQLVPGERFNKCNKSGCKQQFHVTCAQALGLLCEEAGNYLDNVKYCGYCQHHYAKLKKGGNVKTIPPYKPIPAVENASDSSPEKESTLNKSLLSGPVPKKKGGKSSNISPAPSTNIKNVLSSGGVLVNNPAQSHESPSLSHNDLQTSSNSTPSTSSATPSSSSSKFTSSNFTETMLTPSESVFSSTSCKKRKSGARTPTPNPSPCPDQEMVDRVSSQDHEAEWKSCKTENPETVVSKSPTLSTATPNIQTATSGVVVTPVSLLSSLPPPPASPSLSPTPSGLVFSTTSSHPQHQQHSTSQSMATSASSLLHFAAEEQASTANLGAAALNSASEHGKRPRSQSTEKAERSGRKQKRATGSGSGKRGGRGGAGAMSISPVSTPTRIQSPPLIQQSPQQQQQQASSHGLVSQLPASLPQQHQVSTPTPTISVVTGSNLMGVHKESSSPAPTNSPLGESVSASSSRKPGKRKKEEKEAKIFQNGVSSAPHMLGNSLNPSSTMAQKMSDTLSAELEAHSVFTSCPSTSASLIGPPLPSRVIATARSGINSMLGLSQSGGSVSSSSNIAGSSGGNVLVNHVSGSSTPAATSTQGSHASQSNQGSMPQSLDQLLERQWEQGSQFLMEQAQHFDSEWNIFSSFVVVMFQCSGRMA